MEVLMGPTTFGGGDARARLFLGADEGAAAIAEAPPPEDSSEASSSIGDPDDSDDENDDDGDDVAQSKFRGGGGSLATLDSLEDSLPIKRGLSNHFSGKSKSFASLADVCTVRDLKKTEHPLNKKRRLLRASKWSKKSFYSWSNPKSMPLLALNEDDDDDDEHSPSSSSKKQDDRDDHSDDQARRLAKFSEKRMKSFKMRCFSLADLQEHSLLEEEEEEDEDEDEEEDDIDNN